MEEGRKHIDDLFREELQGYRETPDAAVWTSIQQRLPKPGRRRSFLWLWLLLMLALLSSLGYYAYKHQNSEPSSAIDIPLPASSYTVEEPFTSAEITTESDKNQEATENKPPAQASATQQTHDKPSPKNNQQTAGEENRNITEHHVDEGTNKNDKTEKTAALKNTNTKKKATAAEIIARNEKQESATKAADVPESPQEKENSTPVDPANIPDPNREIVNTPKTAAAQPENKNTTAPLLQEEQKNQKTVTAEQANAAGKPNTPDANKEIVNTPKTAAAQPENKNTTAPLLQEEQKNQKTVTAEQANAAGKPNTPDANKEIVNTPKPATIAKKQPAQPQLPIPLERTKGIPLTGSNTDKSQPHPIPVTPEPAQGQPIAVEAERAKGVPVQVAPHPNSEKQPIEVQAATEKKKPLYLEPAKEYGIKMNQDMEDDAEENEGKETVSPSSGGGGGGSLVKEKRKKENRFKLDGGVKFGYDRGFADFTTSNFTGNLFLQWNISPRTSLVLQPGIRYHSVTNTALFPQGSFHDITAQSLDSAHVYSDSMGVNFVQRNFIYHHQYDSIKVSHTLTPQKYLEVELPLLLQYKLAENLSVLGGIQLAFGKVLQIQTAMQRYQNSKTDTLSFPPDTIGNPAGPYPNLPELNGYFSYNIPSINELDQQKYKNPVTNPARFSMMLGFSYEYKRRLLIDFLIRKNLSDLSFIPNEKIRSLYSQPYVRLTVGYKLFQSK